MSHNTHHLEQAADSTRIAAFDTENWHGYEWVTLSVTTVGALLASIQGSALTIALPNILAGLDAGLLTIMWVLIAYLLMTTALVPVVGRLADIFGRKNLYNAGFAVFTLGSLLAGFAQPAFHGWDLVVCRAIQGIGGALLITNSAAIVTDAFRHGQQLRRTDRFYGWRPGSLLILLYAYADCSGDFGTPTWHEPGMEA